MAVCRPNPESYANRLDAYRSETRPSFVLLPSPNRPRLAFAQYLSVVALAALTSAVMAFLIYAVLPERVIWVPVTVIAFTRTPVPAIATSLPATAIPPTTEVPTGEPTGESSARFMRDISMGGYYLVTREQVGDIPPNTRVRISTGTPHEDGWMYLIVAEDETRMADAREDQIAYIPGVVPGATPTPAFGPVLGMGIKWVALRESAGGFPAGTTVRLSVAQLGPAGWIYVVTPDEVNYFDVPEWQLEYLPNVTPGAPTPTFTP